MFCSNCGSQIADGSVFCPACGAQSGSYWAAWLWPPSPWS